jgi:hypothetical protein
MARTTAPRQIVPASTLDTTVLDRFLRSTARARETMTRAARFDVNRIRFRNPFVSVIRFTVGTGFEILANHARRHLRQAERVRESMRP